MAIKITIDHTRLADFCRKNRIGKLAVFGSAVRDDFDPSRSDVDVLVEFLPGATPGLFRFAEIAEGLEGIFGRHVDLLTFKSLHPALESQILSEAEVQYDQAG